MSGYTEELTRTIRILKEKQEKIGGKVQVGAMPPVLLGGVNSFNLMRSILEVEAWAEQLVEGTGPRSTRQGPRWSTGCGVVDWEGGKMWKKGSILCRRGWRGMIRCT